MFMYSSASTPAPVTIRRAARGRRRRERLRWGRMRWQSSDWEHPRWSPSHSPPLPPLPSRCAGGRRASRSPHSCLLSRCSSCRVLPRRQLPSHLWAWPPRWAGGRRSSPQSPGRVRVRSRRPRRPSCSSSSASARAAPGSRSRQPSRGAPPDSVARASGTQCSWWLQTSPQSPRGTASPECTTRASAWTGRRKYCRLDPTQYPYFFNQRFFGPSTRGKFQSSGVNCQSNIVENKYILENY